MHILSRILFAATALLLPLGAAAAPDAITGIEAEAQDNGSIEVRWEAPDQPVSYYLVYYSAESILENEGEYDDYVATEDDATSYLFETLPSNPLFVTIAAVDTNDVPGEFFAEEIRIDAVPETETESSSSSESSAVSSTSSEESSVMVTEESSSSVDTQPTDTLHLLSATAVSATVVRLSFSHEPAIQPADAPKAFRIVTADGKTLPITKLTLLGTGATVTTQVQERGKVYEVQLSEPLMGTNGETLDPNDRRTFFTGHPSGRTQEDTQAQTSSSSSSAAVHTGPEIANFRIQAIPQGGTYFVTATWTPPALPSGILEYRVFQSLDGGETFGAPGRLDGGVGGVELRGVQAGRFGLLVQTVDGTGRVSDGVFRTVSLPVPGTNTVPTPTQPTTPLPGSVTPTPAPTTPTPDGPLPQSGAAAGAGVLALSGATVGWLYSRRRQPAL